jgi:hypothetical protein
MECDLTQLENREHIVDEIRAGRALMDVHVIDEAPANQAIAGLISDPPSP